MFRVEENPDGSTTVYCRITGNLICVVPKKRNPVHKPLGIGRPIPRLSTSRALVEFKGELTGPRVCAKKLAATSFEKNPKRFNGDYWNYSGLDYSEDCISCEEFLGTLNLIPKAKFQNTPINQLKLEFPYRNISRTESKPFSIPPEAKLFEGLPIHCALTEKWLKLRPVSSKYVIQSSEALVTALNRQSQFCRSGLSDENSCAVLPKLRCREQKLYLLTYRVSKVWNHLDHMYSFTRRERYERLKTLNTGLNAKGRRLLRQCKPASIRVQRLTKAEITKLIASCKATKPRKISVQAFYLKKCVGKPFKSCVSKHPGLVDVVESPENFLDLRSQYDVFSNSTIGDRSRIAAKRFNVSWLCNKNKSPYSCAVLLHNVLWDLSQGKDACFVKNTSIKVNDLHLLPLTLWQRPSVVRPGTNGHNQGPHYDHIYHRASPTTYYHIAQNTTPAAVTPVKHPVCNTFTAVEFRRSMPVSSTVANQLQSTPSLPPTPAVSRPSTSSSRRSITFIDLTGEDDGKGSPKVGSDNNVCSNATNDSAVSAVSRRSSANDSNTSKSDVRDQNNQDDENAADIQCIENCVGMTHIFYCYGCSHRSIFSDRKCATPSVHKHMVEYHSVSQPELHLRMRMNGIHHSVLIEAFPGYKE